MKRVKPSSIQQCVCGSARPYTECCGVYIESGKAAPTAALLMRSRYTAYVRRDEAYLFKTWHPDYCPESLNLSTDQQGMKWIGLDIKATTGGQVGDTEGTVEFVARYKMNGRACVLHEKSRFVYESGQWLYQDGELFEG